MHWRGDVQQWYPLSQTMLWSTSACGYSGQLHGSLSSRSKLADVAGSVCYKYREIPVNENDTIVRVPQVRQERRDRREVLPGPEAGACQQEESPGK